jgi:nitroimidazol reductase NimA-like FMN-containing flavoprotein (pyridoxamine 5'-phosphate oxidase superfamily)
MVFTPVRSRHADPERTLTDFTDMAKTIVEANRYMALGTADAEGNPWVTPLWYARAGYREFVWVSSPDRVHSRNVRVRPDVSIVIFDSQVAVGGARALYMAARAEELSGADLERGMAVFAAATEAQGLDRRWTVDDVVGPTPYRLYRATVSQHWVLDPDSSPDDRAEVAL